MSNILIVDDEQIILHMVASIVEDMGHHALLAVDGRAALGLLEREPEPPALVISDIMMPNLGGVGLTQTLRDNPRFRHVPIVLMSASCNAHHANLADHFLPKPFDLETIEQYIERYVERCDLYLDMDRLPDLTLPSMRERQSVAEY